MIEKSNICSGILVQVGYWLVGN